ncbi:PD-(D/E)XK motif protein [Isoptericola sp. BMS4]|uniref:PD-(D/E)XK motif protein n=1 Tax=Isoptericola sp. BMS4 TaxID=2527875 RepID=UPI0014229F92|nr:PD-(D/E)XK motif protein [Isoptericola sp. BMS4]
MTDPARYLTPESLDEYFSANVATQHLLCDEPRCLLRIDPAAERLTFRTVHDGTSPTVKGLERVSVDLEDVDGTMWSVVDVDARGMHQPAYALAVSIVEEMRKGSSFAAATNAAMSDLRSLLALRRRLSEEQQLGLLGELMVLEALLDGAGADDALDWWLGPLAEQHDFALPAVDLEVKTTLSERRKHMISGTEQLRPNPARPLWLLSIQLTRAGGGTGRSLAGMVVDLRGRLSGDARFGAALADLGWADEDAELYDQKYLQRSTPRAYAVDDDFPAVTTERLRAVVPNHDLVGDLTYRVDVTDRTPGDPGHPLTPFLGHTGSTTA